MIQVCWIEGRRLYDARGKNERFERMLQPKTMMMLQRQKSIKRDTAKAAAHKHTRSAFKEQPEEPLNDDYEQNKKLFTKGNRDHIHK